MDIKVKDYLFKRINDFSEESYEVWKDYQKIAFIRERNSRITVNMKKQVIYERLINQHKEDVLTYKEDIVKSIDKNL